MGCNNNMSLKVYNIIIVKFWSWQVYINLPVIVGTLQHYNTDQCTDPVTCRMDFFRETLDALRVEQYGGHCSKKFTTIAISSLSHSTSEKVAIMSRHGHLPGT